MSVHTCTHIQKSLPHWVVALQDKTPTCYSVKPLFMVLFLQVYKILVWTTRLLYVWKSHIWGLLVCHEWLWGIRADAVAWDPSYNNTDSFEGPTMTAKTIPRALPAVHTSNIKHATGDLCHVYWPTCLAVCQEQRSGLSCSSDITTRPCLSVCLSVEPGERPSSDQRRSTCTSIFSL